VFLRPATWLGLIAAPFAVLPCAAQGPVPLATVLSAFLADSGVPTRGLSWSHGDALPVTWESKAPIAVTEAWIKNQGMTLMRKAAAKVTLASDSAIAMTIQVLGTDAGIQRVSTSFAYQGNFETFHPKTDVTGALTARGWTATLFKCDPAKEGVTYGNLVYVIRAPGKTASALHLTWNCTGEGDCGFDMTIIYRRTELTQIECATG